jgi:galactokinase
MLDAGGLPDEVDRRARHVIQENERVVKAAEALKRGDLAALATILLASHQSLKTLFEVTVPETDLLVELAYDLPGCHGSRMTGAGFGGCTVSLVDRYRAAEFASELERRYREHTGLPGRTWITNAAGAVRLVNQPQ